MGRFQTENNGADGRTVNRDTAGQMAITTINSDTYHVPTLPPSPSCLNLTRLAQNTDTIGQGSMAKSNTVESELTPALNHQRCRFVLSVPIRR